LSFAPIAQLLHPGQFFPTVSTFLIVLLAIAFAAIHALIGGAKLVYGLPCYALLAVVGLAAAFVAPRNGSAGPRLLCIGATVLMAAYLCIRASVSPVEYQGRYDFFMVLGAVVAYAIAAIHLTASRQRYAVLVILMVIGLIHAIAGAMQFQRGDDYMLLPWVFRPTYNWRASGFYICPNHLAGFLEMMAIIALSLCCWGRVKTWARILLGYFFFACLAGLALTGSRGGYLSVTIGLLAFATISLWAIRKLRREWFLPMCVAFVVAIGATIGAAVFVMQKSEVIKTRMGQIYDPNNMRVLLWKAALQQHELSPVVGTGAGTYIYYGRQFRSELVQNDPIHVHNDYLELLAEYGYVGVGVFALFLSAHLYSAAVGLSRIVRRKMRPSWQINSNEFGLLAGASAAMVALIAHSVIDFNLHIPANTLFVAFLFGIFANPDGDAIQERPNWFWLRALAPVTAAVLLYFAVPLIEPEYHSERSRIALRDRHYEAAVEEANRAIAGDPQNADTYYYRGEAQHYLALSDPDPADQYRLHMAAAEDFARGLELFPQDLRLLLKIGRTLDNLGRYAEAEPYFERAIRADPNFGNVYAYYGVHWQLQRQWPKAEEFYLKARSLGEYEISKVGLEELQAVRSSKAAPKRPLNDIFSDLVSEDEVEEMEDPENDVKLPKATASPSGK
jgi:O-antigen ligase